MKDWVKKIWNDPVGSKIIASVLFAIIAAIYSLIVGWVSESKTFLDTFKSVFCYKISLWLALAIFVALLVIAGIIKNSQQKKGAKCRFVNEFIKGDYQGLKWQWRWKWSATYRFYYVDELSVVCSACSGGLLSKSSWAYKCGKCGAEFPISIMEINESAVAKQISEDARKKYASDAQYIGRFPYGGTIA